MPKPTEQEKKEFEAIFSKVLTWETMEFGWALSPLFSMDCLEAIMGYEEKYIEHGGIEVQKRVKFHVNGTTRWPLLLKTALSEKPEMRDSLESLLGGNEEEIDKYINEPIEFMPVNYETGKPNEMAKHVIMQEIQMLEVPPIDYPKALRIWMDFWLWSFGFHGAEGFKEGIAPVIEINPRLPDIFRTFTRMGSIYAMKAHPRNWLYHLIYESKTTSIDLRNEQVERASLAEIIGLKERSMDECKNLIAGNSYMPAYIQDAGTGNIMLAAGNEWNLRNIEFISTEPLECAAMVLNAYLYAPQYVFPDYHLWNHMPPAMQLFQGRTAKAG